MLRISLIVLVLLISAVNAADLPALKKLFEKNYNSIYQPRFCGRNTRAFLNEAKKQEIDLSDSYVLKIVGPGFFETSGFYTRSKPNERVHLGYFHMVLVANNHIFDFDLREPLVLDILDYARLQFTPPHEPYTLMGVDYSSKGNPSRWNVTAFDKNDYAKGIETTLWEMKMNQFIDVEKLYSRERIR